MIHGTTWTYNHHGCRCDACLAARAASDRSKYIRRKARVAAGTQATPHGAARYDIGCRCDYCRACAADRIIDWQRRVGVRPRVQRRSDLPDTAKARMRQTPGLAPG